jgi:hypothetical protein
LDDNSSDENDDEPENDIGFPSRRKNSKRPYSHHDTMSSIGDSDLDDLFKMPLEEMLEEDKFSFDFKRRRGRVSGSNSTFEIASSSSNSSNHDEVHPISRGYMGFYNPRFDKTAFLDHKQSQLEQVKSQFIYSVSFRI